MTGGTITHPLYRDPQGLTMYPVASVAIGDEVAEKIEIQHGQHYWLTPLGTVTAIYLESVELSTGDQVPVADLVLLGRAES